MSSRILNFGSINIDYTYSVERISRPGETVSCTDLSLNSGGKGANQSLAAARAGASVVHVGRIGREAYWIIRRMEREGVDVSQIEVTDQPSGHAIIQVDKDGQNSIVIFGGTNRQIGDEQIDAVLDGAGPEDLVLVQNETSGVAHVLKQAAERGLRVYFNTAPMTGEVEGYPLELVHMFFINETEGEALTGETEAEAILDRMLERFSGARVVLTLGRRGVMYRDRDRSFIRGVERDVPVVDTTGAGDTFVGYFAAAVAEGRDIEDALALANLAASYCVTRRGAADSIPRLSDLQGF